MAHLSVPNSFLASFQRIAYRRRHLLRCIQLAFGELTPRLAHRMNAKQHFAFHVVWCRRRWCRAFLRRRRFAHSIRMQARFIPTKVTM